METVFLKILNMSITAGWLVLAVLVMRCFLKKAPKFLSVIMWALVGIRLVLPFSFESALSLIPSTETVPPEILYEQAPEIHTGIEVFNSAINPVISESFAPNPGDSVNPLQVITYLAGWIWVIGMTAMVIYTLISCLRIRRKLREAAPLRDNIYLCDRIETPFIFGLFRPRIYLPSNIAAEDIPYVLAHEQAHLKRKDHLWKPLGFLLLTIYWFNPLLWLAYILLCRDIEAACDEKVLQDMGEESKKPYSTALVNCSVPRKLVAACPLAFGEVGVKSRIKKVLNYKKPAFWLLITAVVACIVLSVCFLTNPRTVNEKMQIFLDCQIAEHHQSEKSKGRACCVDYRVLGTKKQGRTTTVYLWVLYEEFSYENGKIKQENGAHTPTVITATKENGNYQLVEYWEPRDGAYYPEDIKDKFPMRLWLKAMDSQRYIKRQQKACRELAEQYFKENPSTVPPTAFSQEDFLWWDHPIWYHDQSLIDTATFDIDNDGTAEVCQLHHGPTSGLFTFALTVFEDDQPEYCNIFMSEHGDLSFQQQSNGTFGIRLIPSTSFDELILYNIVFADGHIQLLNAGKPLEYWGPQGVSQQQEFYALETLRYQYPEYFNLPADEGLKVVAWQMASGGWYSWGLLPGRNAEHTWEDYLDLMPVSLEDVRAIVESYELSPSQISVELIQMPHSSYFNPMLEQTQKSVESIFWGKLFIELTCCGNRMNTQIIDDPYICGSLSDWLFLAESSGQQRGSSKGYYGAPYGIDIYWGDQTDPYHFTVWDQETFSVSTKTDSEGYEYLYKADLSELYAYLTENYPSELWYPEVYPDSLHQQYDITVSYAGGDMERLDPIAMEAVNKLELASSSQLHLPVLKFDTRQALEDFCWKYVNMATNSGWDEMPPFQTAAAQYDEAFFENNTLLLVYVPCGNCTHRFDVSHVFAGRGAVSIRVNETTGAEVVDEAIACWFITLTIPDSTAAQCTTFDAILGL